MTELGAAFIGFVAALVLERFRAGREDRFRYAEEKRRLYARFHKSATSLANEAASNRLRPTELNEADNTYTTIYQQAAEISLVGSERLTSDADALVSAVKFMRLALVHVSDPPMTGEAAKYAAPTYDEALQEYSRALPLFVSDARRDLGLTDGPWLKRWLGGGPQVR